MVSHSEFPTVEKIPFISTDQMREVDRAMMDDFDISLTQMMENAGRNLANLARQRFLDGDPRNRTALVLAGSGGNGGGGLVCARRLSNWGANVLVYLASESSRLGEVPAHQLAILQSMGVTITDAKGKLDLPAADVIVDALIGYSLRGAPTGTSAVLIRAANNHPAPSLALDVPSGVDTATGKAYDPAIKAEATLTLALPKTGLRSDEAQRHVGELYLADISVPPVLYSRPPLGIEVGHIFAQSDIVRVG